jgi:subtilisin family serine protease
MPRIIGKEQLCSCETKHFKSIQGFNDRDLFERYFDIDRFIQKVVSEEYHHFLAEPKLEGDTIIWFSKPYSETPRKLVDIHDDDLEKYEIVLAKTLEQYRNSIDLLNNAGQGINAKILENCIKFIHRDFVFCYDGIVVLGIWGMQLKESFRESTGEVVKNLFKAKRHSPPPPPEIEEDVSREHESPEISMPPEPPEIPEQIVHKVYFDPGTHGNLNGTSIIQKYSGDKILDEEIPRVEPNQGFEFAGWDKNPDGHEVFGNITFLARYNAIPPPIIPPPWYARFWQWLKMLFFQKGCLRWLLWILLLLLLFFILMSLLRGCNGSTPRPIPSPIEEKPWISDDPRVGDGGGIYDPGNPYEKVPTPPDYRDVLPPSQGEMPPIDTNEIIRKPGRPIILGNRLNILLENETKSILDLAQSFKKAYPSEEYKVVYYDDVVKRMQIEIPPNERERLKSELPSKFAPEYEIFVFDESLFESQYMPNDPAFSSADHSWYLKIIGAPSAWEISKGSPNLTIAIVDNGFNLEHIELRERVVMPYNVWLHSKDVFPQEEDHGTHVAGTALASMNNNQGLCGIAPNCAFMPVQVANKDGIMTTTSILDGILYALYQGSDVINVSLGLEFAGRLSESEQQNLQNNHFKEEERLWNKVMEIADHHGSIIVVAAGNENMLAGINPMSRPKNFIVVSAVDRSSREIKKTGFSNYGAFTTISAPGVSIYSTVGKNEYTVMSGTSMAAPIVTGAVALMKSVNPKLTAEQIVCILKATGKPTSGKVGNLIQLDKALQKAISSEPLDCGTSQNSPSSGDVQIILSWENINDLDLICIDPKNDTVWFQNKTIASGGQLEIDMNANEMKQENPIESIFWPTGTAPIGTYQIHLLYYKKKCEANQTNYTIRLKYGGQNKIFRGSIREEDNSLQICTFTLGDN